MGQDNCVFCRILKKEIPAHFVWEDEKTFVFLDINPLSKGHVLAVPKDHYENVFDIESGVWRELAVVSQRISQRMKEVLGAEGVNLFNASGEAAEQSVGHFHLHIVPRWKGDGLRMNDWWQTKTKKMSSAELSELAVKLRP
jgi:histidine triad (HIT) family protein